MSPIHDALTKAVLAWSYVTSMWDHWKYSACLSADHIYSFPLHTDKQLLRLPSRHIQIFITLKWQLLHTVNFLDISFSPKLFLDFKGSKESQQCLRRSFLCLYFSRRQGEMQLLEVTLKSSLEWMTFTGTMTSLHHWCNMLSDMRAIQFRSF